MAMASDANYDAFRDQGVPLPKAKPRFGEHEHRDTTVLAVRHAMEPAAARAWRDYRGQRSGTVGIVVLLALSAPPHKWTAGCCPGWEEEFVATMDELTGPEVDWEFQPRAVPLGAPVDSPTFAAMRSAIERFDPGAHVVPYCTSGGTDAKQFSQLGIVGYGFSPLLLPAGFEYGRLAHGVDERVPVEGLRFGARVLDDFLRSA